MPRAEKSTMELKKDLDKIRELTKKVKDQMGKARVSVRAMLKETQVEARRQNAERKPTGKKKDISR